MLKPDLSPSPGSQPVPGGDQIRGLPGDASQSAPLVLEEIEREPGVEFRVVQTTALELSVLVVLDQVVIGVAGERERIEPQRIHRRHAQEPKIGLRRSQMPEIEVDQVVAEQKGRSVGERIQFGQRDPQVPASEDQSLAGIGAQCGKGMNPTVSDSDFEIQRETAGREAFRFVRHLGIPSPVRMSGAPIVLRPTTELAVMHVAGRKSPSSQRSEAILPTQDDFPGVAMVAAVPAKAPIHHFTTRFHGIRTVRASNHGDSAGVFELSGNSCNRRVRLHCNAPCMQHCRTVTRNSRQTGKRGQNRCDWTLGPPESR